MSSVEIIIGAVLIIGAVWQEIMEWRRARRSAELRRRLAPYRVAP